MTPSTLARIAGQQIAKADTLRVLWYPYGRAGEGQGVDVTGDDANDIVFSLVRLDLLPPFELSRQQAADIDYAVERVRNVDMPGFGSIRYRQPETPMKQPETPMKQPELDTRFDNWHDHPMSSRRRPRS